MIWPLAKCGNPYFEFVLCVYPIQVHTHPWVVKTHTSGAVLQMLEQYIIYTDWSSISFLLWRRGSNWGFRALWVLKMKSISKALIHSPIYNYNCLCWCVCRSVLQRLGQTRTYRGDRHHHERQFRYGTRSDSGYGGGHAGSVR